MTQPNPPSESEIDLVQGASWRLARRLGFLEEALAGTGLPPSSVHALIEIAARPGCTATDLAGALLLEKSSVSRLVRRLV
ncbi:MarR family transcriptional regulator, partial [Amaricoccus sp. HAR-UPW-R2A-40]